MPASPPVNLFPYFRTLQDLPGIVDWREFFGNDQPVELDIGSGRGMFLFESTQSHPDRNFLGLEIDYSEGRRAAKRFFKRATPNGRVIGGDAKEFLQKHVTPHTVSVAHVYFPDPWWKKRHRKRRLFTEDFVALLARVVMPGGEVHSWTDVEEYFGVISGLMNHAADFEILPPPAPNLVDAESEYISGFHRRRSQAGCITYRGRWRRKPIGSP